MLLYPSYPNSGRCALKSPSIIVLVFASFISGRPEFVPGGQYILWMVNFVLDFVQIVVFCQSISLLVRFSVFSSNVISNKCHDALTVGAKVFFAGTWLFSVSWNSDFLIPLY